MRKTGTEPLMFNGESIGICLYDFWRWGFSDLLENTLRGNYAEFIVATALGIDVSVERVNWEPWDLTIRGESEVRIEVKSSSYVQSWKQKHPSTIKFGIRPSLSWTAEKGYSDERRRHSDVYVFCVYAEKDVAQADPMRLDDWDFYVIPTKKLNSSCGVQKTISLSSLLRLDPIKTDFAGLKAAVLRCI